MITDYSRNYFSVTSNRLKNRSSRQRVAYRKTALLSLHGIMLKAIGVMVVFTLMAGVSSTLWYGWQIRTGLDEIGKSTNLQHEIISRNKQLVTQRDSLRAKEIIAAKAKKLGLFPPSKKQLR